MRILNLIFIPSIYRCKRALFSILWIEKSTCVCLCEKERERLSICCVFERDVHLAFGEKIDFHKPMPNISLASPLKYFYYK